MMSLPLSSPPRITFWGAAQSVTGSMHLVEAAGCKVLLDCGLMISGPRTHAHGEPFPLPPSELDAVVISHAHIDHCGNLPALVQQGFAGTIYSTPATCDLLTLVLAHSARLREKDIFVHQILGKPVSPEDPPAFTTQDVEQTLRHCLPVPYGQVREIGPGLQLELVDAGHLLGSAMIRLTVAAGARRQRLTFTGDLGRRGAPLVGPPAPIPQADLLISECTYGGREVETWPGTAAALEAVVRATLERGGKVLVPAFSLGRTQVVAYALRQAMRAGRLPAVPLFVDSSLAADLVEVYRRHLGCLDPQAVHLLEEGEDFLGGPGVTYVRSHEESLELSRQRGSWVVIAPNAMCDGGRIMHHLKEHLDDPRCSVLLVSYQAPHSLGRRLLERGPTVRFHGRSWNKWADIVALEGFSGHADRQDLLAFLRPRAGDTPRVRLVHGEPEQAEALAEALREQGFADVQIPARGESLTLG